MEEGERRRDDETGLSAGSQCDQKYNVIGYGAVQAARAVPFLGQDELSANQGLGNGFP